MDQSLSQTEIIVDENRVELLYIKSNITTMKEDFNDLEVNFTEKIQELQGLFDDLPFFPVIKLTTSLPKATQCFISYKIIF